jgi:hypothetical protein
LVKARGLKSLPSCACRVKTGMKETVITSRLKKRVGPTSCAERRMISKWDRSPFHSS